MNYYEQIKNEIICNEAYKKVKDYSKNKYELERYYNIGKLLFNAGKHYGEGIIKEYSIRLTNDLGKGYTYTALSRMRQFYIIFQNIATMSQLLTWSHYVEIIKLKNINEINYYIKITCEMNLSVRELRLKIKNNEYERLPNSTKEKLINNGKMDSIDFVKNPIIIKNKNKQEVVSEKILQLLILEDLSSFLKELGKGFCYIDNEYRIRIGNRYNYIDILLYNIKFNCYVVVELKITELKKEHIGQIQVYMNYIDKHVKSNNQNNTIGIIIVSRENQLIMEYVSDNRILSRKYTIV